jgi:hypothetical protein
MLFFHSCVLGSKFCPPLIDKINPTVPSRNIRNFTLYSVAHKHCPSTRCATAINLVSSAVYMYLVSKLDLRKRIYFRSTSHLVCGLNYAANL